MFNHNKMIPKKLEDIIKKVHAENEIPTCIDNLNQTSLLTDEIGFDSFNLAQLTVEVEEEFGIDIFEKMIPKNIEDIVKQLK